MTYWKRKVAYQGEAKRLLATTAEQGSDYLDFATKRGLDEVDIGPRSEKIESSHFLSLPLPLANTRVEDSSGVSDVRVVDSVQDWAYLESVKLITL
jgi:hypothetical protein